MGHVGVCPRTCPKRTLCTLVVPLIVAAASLTWLGSGDRPRAATTPSRGGQIAFASSRGGRYSLYLMNADGTRQRRLTTERAAEFQPAWSPDGTRIAFTRAVSSTDTDVYVVRGCAT